MPYHVFVKELLEKLQFCKKKSELFNEQPKREGLKFRPCMNPDRNT